MRAMILAAGLGTRMRPLTDYRAKPALPVRGRPVISLLLEFLAHHGIREVMINLHYLPQTIRNAVEGDSPKQMEIVWSDEPEPLGTGGGLRRAASFLSGSDESVVLAGDMLLDLDLLGLIARHRQSGRDASLVLREDSRGPDFGTIGVDREGEWMRVGERVLKSTDHNVEGSTEVRAGLFTGLRIFSKPVFTGWPQAKVFEDLRDWLIPRSEAGRAKVGAEFVSSADSVWEPVGTPKEYLDINLSPPSLPSLGGSADFWSAELETLGPNADVILGAGALLGPDIEFERVVVWPDEVVPAGLVAHDGIFAGGRFHECRTPDTSESFEMESKTLE